MTDSLLMIDTLAVVGATGAVGRIIVDMLLARQFPARRIKLLASERSAGRPFEVGGRMLDVEVLRPDSFTGVDIAIGSTPDEPFSQIYVTLTDRPDLDGRYAVFGHIIAGADVPARIQRGDLITRMYVRE